MLVVAYYTEVDRENYFLGLKKVFVSFLGLFIFEVTYLAQNRTLLLYVALVRFGHRRC
jgi:hypothetical protein